MKQHSSSAVDATATPGSRKQGRELIQTSVIEVLSKDSTEKPSFSEMENNIWQLHSVK